MSLFFKHEASANSGSAFSSRLIAFLKEIIERSTLSSSKYARPLLLIACQKSILISTAFSNSFMAFS
tara:strand:- start:516 stop:716 length:201 start_codon:yes stop_codon:yes gene_type:complete